MTNLVLLGAPGSGKGTYASRMAEKLGLPAISTGEILRQAVRSGTPLGDEVKSFVEGGKLVPDEVMARVLAERLGQADCARGFILDGYPRTSPQAGELERVLKEKGTGVTVALVIDVPEELILRRLGGRRSCPACGAVFNIYTLKPAKEGVCDKCGGTLVTRKDDEIETIKRRLDDYRKQSGPLIEKYTKDGVARTVNADAPVDEVVEKILEIVRKEGA